jgi:hypothetical protein
MQLKFRPKPSAKDAWLPRSASGPQPEQIIPSCIIHHRKCSSEFSFVTPFSAEEYSANDSLRIEIGCVFFVPFFAQAKKGNTEAGWSKQNFFAVAISMFFRLETSLFTFFLDKKSNKKIKEKSNAPHFFPLLTHKFQNYRLQPISDLVIFFFHVISLHLFNFFCLIELRFVHTAGAAFFAFSFCKVLF